MGIVNMMKTEVFCICEFPVIDHAANIITRTEPLREGKKIRAPREAMILYDRKIHFSDDFSH